MKANQAISFVAGLLSGSIAGAAVVLLLAPQSGLETRQTIGSKVNEIIEAGKQAISERRQELREQYETAIQIPIPLAESEDK